MIHLLSSFIDVYSAHCMQLTIAFLLQDLQKFSVPIPGFPNLTHLTVFHSKESSLVYLPYLLKHCHSLETLVLEV